ncbi:MAG: TIGR03617 family F420-dependent LLM class oxidoreductase [Myxococcales bacterium]
MTIAHAAWDLQKLSGGRFELGLGTQVRGNIVGRYSTSWSAPVSRTREYVESLKTIFHCFETGAELQFEGEHYQFTRLQPFFNPGPLEVPAPPILLGAVGPDMTRMAGGAADGLMSHPTHSAPRYLEEVTLPAIAEGAERCGRSADLCPILAAGFILTGSDELALARKRERIREQLSFLYSTRAYWRALDHLGFGDVGRSLHELAKQGRWNEMGTHVDDGMIDALVPHGCYADIAQTLLKKYAPLTERMTFPVPENSEEDERVAEILVDLRRG